MYRFLTLKTGFVLFLGVLLLLTLLVFVSLQNLNRSVEHLKSLEEQRRSTSQLAQQYKDYVQALTRNAMAFVSSEQPEFEEAYIHFQDLMEGRAVDAQGESLPIADKFRRAGLTSTEIDTLESAFEQNRQLAALERQAINTAKGLFDDGSGELKIGLPDALLAKVLLFGQHYTDGAAKLARDIDDFNIMQSNRYAGEVQAASGHIEVATRLAMASLGALLLCSAIALWALYQTIRRALGQGVATAHKLAQGDLTAQTSLSRRDELGQLLHALNGIGAGLQKVVTEVRQRSSHIAGSARDIAKGNADLSRRTSEQAARLQETAVTLADLTRAVTQNARDGEAAEDAVNVAAERALQGAQQAQAATSTMQALRQSSGRMAQIVGVIEELAFRTNILALNASIEAAQAGAQGRGFAVVAAEVRSLAQGSAASAKEVDALIQQSLGLIEQGGDRVAEAGLAIHRIQESVQEAQALMSRISNASAKQSRDIQQISAVVAALDGVTRHNATLVEHAAATTTDQEAAAAALEVAVGQFRISASESGSNPRAKVATPGSSNFQITHPVAA